MKKYSLLRKQRKLSYGALFLIVPQALLLANTSKLLPDVTLHEDDNEVVINIPNVSLYFFQSGNNTKTFPIAVGKGVTQTPPGNYQIGDRAHNPTWYIPASIRKERKNKGLPDIESIPAGPDNPLGPLFIRFGDPKLGLGIHGTSVPSSVPGVVSHGCVRMKNQDVLTLDKLVNRDDYVVVSYQLYALNIDEANQLWIQKYANPYKMKDEDLAKIKTTLTQWTELHNQSINANKLALALKSSSRSPVCLNCSQAKPKIVGKLQSLAWTDSSANIRLAEKSKHIDEKLLNEGVMNPTLYPPQKTWGAPQVSPEQNNNNTNDNTNSKSKSTRPSPDETPVDNINTIF